MMGPSHLAKHAGRLRTRMGAFFAGQRAVFRGHDLHADLKDLDWLELYLFGITGRRFTPEQMELLHALWVYTSYPDARLWNNRVAALAGSARSTPGLGLTAAMAVSEATIYGGNPGVRAMDFFLRAGKAIAGGAELPDVLAKEGRVYGFGRPTPDTTDERIPWLVALARRLGLGDGPHVKLAFQVEEILRARNPKLRMNYAGITSALCADMGFSVLEFQVFRVPLFLAGMPPCYLEAREQSPGSLFPLACPDILYEGRSKRTWQGKENQGA
jgi:hypothetical protein